MGSAARPRRKAAPARKHVEASSDRHSEGVTQEAAPPPSEPVAEPSSNGKYSFTPISGGEPIVFPPLSSVDIDAKFLWQIYSLNELYQSFEWMNRAKVDRVTQERVMDLSPVERASFWKGWFESATSPVVDPKGSAPPGES